MRLALLLTCCLLTTLAVADVHLELNDRDDVKSTNNLLATQVENGFCMGQSTWDPYVYLSLPKEGLDVRELPYLTVRLYSSAAADVLDVYYKCADGRWGLGATHAIEPGWAVYRADMRKAEWHESGAPTEGRQWGGRTKRLATFRIDPGNQTDRLIVIDSVALTTEATGPLGVTRGPKGTLTNPSVQASRNTVAGDAVKVEYSCTVAPPEGINRGTVLFRLMKGSSTSRASLQTVDLAAGKISATHSFATSQYSYGGDFVATAGILELDGPPVPGAPVTVSNPRVGTVNSPPTRVEQFRGGPALFIQDQPVPLITYVHHGGRVGELHREMADTGIKIYTDWFGASVAGDLGHKEDGSYDYSHYDKYFETVLSSVPDAYFLPHIGVVAPYWWQKAHPEECCLYSNGRRGPSSLASKRWKQDMGEDLKRLMAHLRSAPYADRIIGYIFYAGYTAEWQNWATWKAYSDDYSDPAIRAFRAWLESKYETPDALSIAWNDPDVTFENAEAPTHERRYDEGPLVRDPALERPTIDFSQFMSAMVADAIIDFAGVTKEACDGEQIVGTYYGYMAAHGARQPVCGHNALAAVLDCPDIDFLMSPPMYNHREAGGTSTFMTATESVNMHGKLWLDESDLRTYLTDPGSGYGRTDTPDRSVAAHWREFANVLTRKAGVSWFDMTGGWFSDRPMWDAFARQMQVVPDAFAQREPFAADVALFVDERSVAYYRHQNLYRNMVGDTIAHMPKAGVTWDFYLLSDLTHEALPDYKLYVLLNAVDLTEDTRSALRAKARRNGARVLFMYAPGYAGENALQPGKIQELTGFQVSVSEVPGPAAYSVLAGHPLVTGIDPSAELGAGDTLAPRPIITDTEAEPIARYADDAGVAIARKTVAGVDTYYCASVAMPVDLYRDIARAAGAHVWCETNDGIFTDGRHLAIHAATDGDKTVHLPGRKRVMDVVTGECIVPAGDTITRTMKAGETLFVELQDL